ncbi:hypothetical protein HCJ66_11570 [Listeria sp. FSL L7-1582]|uniref:hypothetical protein n=1 Tax=Listeria portnoyi TaxID=2713504 RepID=UPI00164D9283|nr:hypothetical protein [Listeria portnoyi]MBC6310177.1 hypothetical protein [Listeria portnoyi]
MAKKMKYCAVAFVFSLGLLIPLTAYAAINNVSYDFKHMVPVSGKMTATKATLSGSVSVNNWGKDNSFGVKLFKHRVILNDIYKGGTYFSPTGNKKFSYTVAKGKSYCAEFWKTQNGKYIKGKASFSY